MPMWRPRRNSNPHSPFRRGVLCPFELRGLLVVGASPFCAGRRLPFRVADNTRWIRGESNPSPRSLYAVLLLHAWTRQGGSLPGRRSASTTRLVCVVASRRVFLLNDAPGPLAGVRAGTAHAALATGASALSFAFLVFWRRSPPACRSTLPLPVETDRTRVDPRTIPKGRTPTTRGRRKSV